MLRAIVLTIAVASSFGAGYATYRMRHPPSPPPVDYAAIRARAIVSHVRMAAKAQTIIIGDSLVDFAELPLLCGDKVVNAGIAGATSADAASFIDLIADSRFKSVIVAVGINDTARFRKFDLAEFRRNYTALVQKAIGLGKTVTVATVAPIADQGQFGSIFFDRDEMQQVNEVIRDVAAFHSLALVDVFVFMGGMLEASETDDGVHLTASGYEKWVRAFEMVLCH